MTATVRVELINLSKGTPFSAGGQNVIQDIVAPASKLSITSTASTTPDVTSPNNVQYFRISAVVGNVIAKPVAAALDFATNIADQTSGILIQEGSVELLPAAGNDLSLIEYV